MSLIGLHRPLSKFDTTRAIRRQESTGGPVPGRSEVGTALRGCLVPCDREIVAAGHVGRIGDSCSSKGLRSQASMTSAEKKSSTHRQDGHRVFDGRSRPASLARTRVEPGTYGLTVRRSPTELSRI